MSRELWSNDSEWKKHSDEWVKTMEQSKENKELYQEYVNKTSTPIPYRDWLKEHYEEL